MTALRKMIADTADSPLLRGASAYLASEAAAKVSRLAVVVVMARFLSPAEIGIAAAAMAGSDILKSLAENGVGQRIIIADDRDVEAVCKQAHRIFWVWCSGLTLLQVAVGAGVWLAGGSVMTFALMALLGLEYLFMPGGLVQCALAMRKGMLARTAAVSGAQNVSANLLTCLLVALFPSPLSVVLPKLISAPVWLVGMRRLVAWSPAADVTPAPLSAFLRFGASVLGIEFVKAVRAQADKLIVGAVLGTEALGIYFFAFNAGVGISTSLATALSTVLFPYLSTSDDRKLALKRALMLAMAAISVVALSQSFAASHYVSLVFGSKWASVSPLVAILCLTAIPNMLWSVAAQWLRSSGRADRELLLSMISGVTITGAVIIAAPHGLHALAWTTLAVATAAQVAVSLPVLMKAFGVRTGAVCNPTFQGA
ncbi:oligosaccharide flippase family protein [Martelella sp. HB161492]|uniref:oligosaccharide flippase family protein n=1 Tax=Martelella sp. HB161492 TaxID=2720726 RepID=UPI001AEF2D45|nr:oligosaccharide flippase family protein [Martelella sp. HB161492]